MADPRDVIEGRARWCVVQGDALGVLAAMPDGCVQCIVTSPPYWGLRSYLPTEHADKPLELGLESTPEEYVGRLVSIFREARRVLRDDGVLWLNLGDSYAGNGPRMTGRNDCDRETPGGRGGSFRGGPRRVGLVPGEGGKLNGRDRDGIGAVPGLKPKDLVGIPWRVALALQADGWWLRSDVVWSKPNPMPESITDRPTKAHEYVFLLTKAERYFYDDEAIREPDVGADHRRTALHRIEPTGGLMSPHTGIRKAEGRNGQGRNARSVWTIATEPYTGAHFATMPTALVKRCVLAGSRPGDVVLDPFGGSGTVAQVALELHRRVVLAELNAEYLPLIHERCGALGRQELLSVVARPAPTAEPNRQPSLFGEAADAR